MNKSIIIGLFIVFFVMINPYALQAASLEDVQEELLVQLELENLDTFMKEMGSDVSFYELIQQITAMGWGVDSIEVLTRWAWKQMFFELSESKKQIGRASCRERV